MAVFTTSLYIDRTAIEFAMSARAHLLTIGISPDKKQVLRRPPNKRHEKFLVDVLNSIIES